MKIIVTGGGGFIGTALIHYIIYNTQDSVVNVDKLTYAGNRSHLQMFLILNDMFLNMRIFAMQLQWHGFLLSISRMQ